MLVSKIIFSISFFNLPGYVERFSFAQRSKKKRIAADEDQACDISALTSQLFQLDAVFFFPAQVFNLSGSYAERGAVQGGAGGGLTGIRHEGKQASKPQQKPQT